MLFKKKGALAKKQSPSGGSASSKAVLVASHDGNKAIAFGLGWRSVATGGGREAAIKMVRGARATHYIYRGQQIGYAAIAGKAADLPHAIYPAALVAAKSQQGDAIYVVHVDGDAYWIALTRNGSPTSSDQFVEDLDDARALAMARELARPLLADNVKLSFYTNIENSGLDGVRHISSEELLDMAVLDEDLLQPVPPMGLSIPKPVLGVLALAALAMVGQRGYMMYADHKRAHLAASNQVVEEDPTIAWSRAIDEWRSTVGGPSVDGLKVIRSSMAEVPVKWDGWVLSRTSCSRTPGPAQPGATTDAWSCSASYTRSQIGVVTREMVRRVPQKWRASFTPLNQMQLAWTVQAPRVPMVIDTLPSVAHHNIETVSKLQTYSSALAQDASFSFGPVDIKAPVNSAGVPVPADERVGALKQASLSLRGPLRSLDALLNTGMDVSWTSLTLSYAAGQPSIKSSAVTAEVNGVMYAKN